MPVHINIQLYTHVRHVIAEENQKTKRERKKINVQKKKKEIVDRYEISVDPSLIAGVLSHVRI